MVCNKYNLFLGPKAALIFILRRSINEAMCVCDMQHSCADGTKKRKVGWWRPVLFFLTMGWRAGHLLGSMYRGNRLSSSGRPRGPMGQTAPPHSSQANRALGIAFRCCVYISLTENSLEESLPCQSHQFRPMQSRNAPSSPPPLLCICLFHTFLKDRNVILFQYAHIWCPSIHIAVSFWHRFLKLFLFISQLNPFQSPLLFAGQS